MKKLLILFACLPLFVQAQQKARGNEKTSEPLSQTAVYVFDTGNDMFFLERGDNREKAKMFLGEIDKFRDGIKNGSKAIFVRGFGDNTSTLNLLQLRSNRVKSYFITERGVVEDNFLTRNVVGNNEAGKTNVVMVWIGDRTGRAVAAAPAPAPAPVERPAPAPEPKPKKHKEPAPEPAPAPAPAPAPVVVAPAPAPAPAPVKEVTKPYCWAIRTNLLYDAMLYPTLGVEWRATKQFGIKLDGSYSNWNFSNGPVTRKQNMWMISPELRWYLAAKNRFYLGLGGNFGKATPVSGGPLGYFLHKWQDVNSTRSYDGKFWNAGLVVGYQLLLSRHFSLDFNVGGGYTDFSGTATNAWDDPTTYKFDKKVWSVTQAGISLVWTMGAGAKK